jgi:hypothetical protein
VDAIARERLSIADTARRFGLPEGDVSDPQRGDRPLFEGVSQGAWMLVARRLETDFKFYRKAMDDADPRAAIVFIKALERPATLTDANAPSGMWCI